MSSIFEHPALDSRQARYSYFALIFLRSIFFCFAVVVANSLVNLGTPVPVLCGVAVAGSLAASWLAFTRLNFRGFVLLGGSIYLGWEILYYTLDYLQLGGNDDVFWFFGIAQHVSLCLIVLLLAAGSTWIFWKFRNAITAEFLVLLALSIYAMSGHRNYHFDMPRAVNTLAWDLGYEQLTLLVGIGALLVSLILLYLFFATLPSKPHASWKGARVHTHRSRSNWLSLTATVACFALLLYTVATQVYKYYSVSASTRIANGVGLENPELGFHSALGGTNQPSALVRLEGDYSENPFSPMLYLRESALSQFTGHDMKMANRAFDRDISDTHPRESYTGKEDYRLHGRKQVIQSVYLLADHKDAFALDYPISIRQLKNPNPKRFKSAYRAYSVAPTYKLSELENIAIGDPDWTQDTWQHYLETNPDPRYKKLAEQLTAGITDPVKKIFAITNFLSEKSIYTLTPNHQEKPDEDPVAPYLFGDFRGYCVHFSHATVYMLRALGIPARIGTGYLTDLSQAKDGHILLRMSDRHAWAEVYLNGLGWVPFDTHPTQVESHADTQVDMKLLEELMGMLDPGEEILPNDIAKGEPGFETPIQIYQPHARDVVLVLCLVAALLVLRKVFLLYGWMLPGDERAKLRRSHIAVLTMLHDLGFRRDLGETRYEFQRRVSEELGSEVLRLTDGLNRESYSRAGIGMTPLEIDELRSMDLEAISALPFSQRLLAFVNPSSVLSTITGVRW